MAGIFDTGIFDHGVVPGSGNRFQAKVYAGYAKAAQRIGQDFDLYRPQAASPGPLTVAKINTLPAAFTVHTAPQFSFDKPSDYKSPMFHALIDGAQVLVGDYLKAVTAGGGTFFIASMNLLVPIFAIACNRTITVWKPDDQVRTPGLSGYGGSVASTTALTAAAVNNETAVMTQWPASVLEGGRGGSAGATVLPGDIGTGIWRIYLPFYGGILIKPGYVITDDASKRMIVRQAELTDLGWNIQAQQAVV